MPDLKGAAERARDIQEMDSAAYDSVPIWKASELARDFLALHDLAGRLAQAGEEATRIYRRLEDESERLRLSPIMLSAEEERRSDVLSAKLNGVGEVVMMLRTVLSEAREAGLVGEEE